MPRHFLREGFSPDDGYANSCTEEKGSQNPNRDGSDARAKEPILSMMDLLSALMIACSSKSSGRGVNTAFSFLWFIFSWSSPIRKPDFST